MLRMSGLIYIGVMVVMSCAFQYQAKLLADGIAPILARNAGFADKMDGLLQAATIARLALVFALAAALFVVWLLALTKLELSVALPLLTLAYASLQRIAVAFPALSNFTLENYRTAMTMNAVRSALANSLILGIATATIGVLLMGLMSWIIYRSRIPGSGVIEIFIFSASARNAGSFMVASNAVRRMPSTSAGVCGGAI